MAKNVLMERPGSGAMHVRPDKVGDYLDDGWQVVNEQDQPQRVFPEVSAPAPEPAPAKTEEEQTAPKKKTRRARSKAKK